MVAYVEATQRWYAQTGVPSGFGAAPPVLPEAPAAPARGAAAPSLPQVATAGWPDSSLVLGVATLQAVAEDAAATATVAPEGRRPLATAAAAHPKMKRGTLSVPHGDAPPPDLDGDESSPHSSPGRTRRPDSSPESLPERLSL